MSVLQYVMETYAGKSKELIQCEGYLREIIRMIDENHSHLLGGYKHQITRNNEVCKKLETTLAKFFGVKEVAIYWKNGQINAYAMPGSSIIIAKRKKNGGFDKASFTLLICENIVHMAKLNEQELMAIILHEIGHCFYSSGALMLGEILDVVLNPIHLIIAFIAAPLNKGIYEIDDKFKQKMPGLYKAIDKFNDFVLEFRIIRRYLRFTPDPYRIVRGLAANGLNLPYTIGAYGNERGADSFAARYGYGGDLTTALNKLRRPENTVALKAMDSMGPLGDFMKDYNEVLIDLTGMLSLEPHPNNSARAQSMIRKLERDLENGDYPPELKNDLKAEIDRMKKIHKTLNDNDSNIEIKKGYYNMLNFLTNGHPDIREIFDKLYIKNEF